MKERRLKGYPYRHSESNQIEWWDSYGQESLSSRTGGEWILIPDNEVGLYLDCANEI